MLTPRTADDERIITDMLVNFDLVYSGGLYDYLPDKVASALTRMIYSRLREGGRLLAGNLVVTPDSTWMMDYVWGWPLLYRTEETMLELARGLSPRPQQQQIVTDATGRCLFLDVRRP
jgi:hypothetical protein